MPSISSSFWFVVAVRIFFKVIAPEEISQCTASAANGPVFAVMAVSPVIIEIPQLIKPWGIFPDFPDGILSYIPDFKREIAARGYNTIL